MLKYIAYSAILSPHSIVLSSLFEIAMPFSLYRFMRVGRRPTRFGIHSIKPHSSFSGTTLYKLRTIDTPSRLNSNDIM